MSKRGTGLVLICLAALLYVARFFIALKFVDIWDQNYFQHVMHQSGSDLLTLASFTFLVGVMYFIWDDLPSVKRLLKKVYNWEEET